MCFDQLKLKAVQMTQVCIDFCFLDTVILVYMLMVEGSA